MLVSGLPRIFAETIQNRLRAGQGATSPCVRGRGDGKCVRGRGDDRRTFRYATSQPASACPDEAMIAVRSGAQRASQCVSGRGDDRRTFRCARSPCVRGRGDGKCVRGRAVELKQPELTSFVTPSGQYEYVVVPFGLVNAPSAFSRFIHNALKDVNDVARNYLDDVAIGSS
ncbi:RNA-directed DNA polymerase [Pycnococcus provasolii]